MASNYFLIERRDLKELKPTQLLVYAHLLGRARYNGNIYSPQLKRDLEPGEFVFGYFELGKAIGKTEKSVRIAAEVLQEVGRITYRGEVGIGSLGKICDLSRIMGGFSEEGQKKGEPTPNKGAEGLPINNHVTKKPRNQNHSLGSGVGVLLGAEELIQLFEPALKSANQKLKEPYPPEFLEIQRRKVEAWVHRDLKKARLKKDRVRCMTVWLTKSDGCLADWASFKASSRPATPKQAPSKPGYIPKGVNAALMPLYEAFFFACKKFAGQTGRTIRRSFLEAQWEEFELSYRDEKIGSVSAVTNHWVNNPTFSEALAEDELAQKAKKRDLAS